jgi:hypothetical protein
MDPCQGCALTDGAYANREVHNRLKAEVCVRAGVPFWCNHRDGKPTEDFDGMTRRLHRHLVQTEQLRICEGWRRKTAALARTGWFRGRAPLLHAVGEAAIQTLHAMLGETGDPEKSELATELKRLLKLLRDRPRRRRAA